MQSTLVKNLLINNNVSNISKFVSTVNSLNISYFFSAKHFHKRTIVTLSRCDPNHIKKICQVNFSHESKKYSTNLQTLFNDKKMKIEQVNIPMPWGNIRGQIFGDPNVKNSKPILCLHGYLDNSNSFRPLAPYLCQNNQYYMIAIDLPGHGLSSYLPEGIPYTPKLFLSSVRRVVKYFDLKSFYFLCHSYGIGLSYLYDIVFQNEVKASVSLDWIFSTHSKKWESISQYWQEGIDQMIDMELESKENKNETGRKTLTRELAVQILMRANGHLDEESAKILLERALIEKDGKLDFSRDLRVKASMHLRDHYVDFFIILDEIVQKLSCPTLMIHADPAPYGQKATDDTIKFLEKINQNSKTTIELTKMQGTHHFHMIKPKETSEMILKFLDKVNSKPSSKL